MLRFPAWHRCGVRIPEVFMFLRTCCICFLACGKAQLFCPARGAGAELVEKKDSSESLRHAVDRAFAMTSERFSLRNLACNQLFLASICLAVSGTVCATLA